MKLFEVYLMSQRGMVLLVLALLAIAFYGVGFKTGTLAAIIIGCLFELGFWFKLMVTNKEQDN